MVATTYDPLDEPYFDWGYEVCELYYQYTGEWQYARLGTLVEAAAREYHEGYEGASLPADYRAPEWALLDDGDDLEPEQDIMEMDTQDDSPRSQYSTEDIDSLPDSEDEVDLPPTYDDWLSELSDADSPPITSQLLIDWYRYQDAMEMEETRYTTLSELWGNFPHQ